MTISVLLALATFLSLPAAAVDSPHSADCATCHEEHASTWPTLTSQLCEGCHFDGGPAPAVSTHSSLTTDNGYGNWHVDCWECHDVHSQHQNDAYGTTYGMYLDVNLDADIVEVSPTDVGPSYTALSTLRTVTSSNVEHTSTTDFVDGDSSSSDDICQVCHESTTNYNTGTAFNTHTDYGTDTQPGGVCTACHTHGNGFQAQGCTGCHSTAQGSTGYRRQIVSAGGDFDATSHHVTDGSTTEIVSDGDCAVCHDQSSHQSWTEPNVYLNDPDGGTAHSYDGTGSSLETFCLGCHDADSSLAYDSDSDPTDGYQPFSDGRAPDDINTWWTSASHATTSVTALSDSACMTCHGGTDSTRSGSSVDPNVHGSSNVSLLSSTVDGVTVSNVEEQLCYSCHDGTTAATDIETQELTGTNGTYIYHHPVLDSEQSTGRSVECTDCHNPHGATSANPVAGAVGVDIDGSAVGAGTASAREVVEYEVCLSCHGDSYNSSRSRTTNKRTDLGTGNSSYHPIVQAGRNTSTALNNQLLGGLSTSSIISCSDCHNNPSTADTNGLASGSSASPQGPHGSSNAYILRESYYSQSTGTSSSLSFSTTNYGLCWLCHDSATFSRHSHSNTNFNKHSKHVRSERASCATCH
ncbi:MAG: hypothetical protein GXP62_02705, partial [Oligoflexia bacterium]|nr:hypothetical protein [Oligoflexia bacterium]